MHFLQLLISELQACFVSGEWPDIDVPDWVEASSCWCQRVFSYMLACDFGQSTECKCEMLWVCSNGEDVEDYCTHEIFSVPGASGGNQGAA